MIESKYLKQKLLFVILFHNPILRIKYMNKIGGLRDIADSDYFSLVRRSLVSNSSASHHELAGQFWYFKYVAAIYNSNMELYQQASRSGVSSGKKFSSCDGWT